MVDREPLRDHPAHRHAHDVGALRVHRVEDRHRVAGHVAQRVAVRPSSFDDKPDVAVVEPHDAIALRRELLAPLLVVVDALRAEAVDEQQRRVRGGAERLVEELDVTVVCGGHGVTPYDHGTGPEPRT